MRLQNNVKINKGICSVIQNYYIMKKKKEKLTEEIRVMVQPSLYKSFKKSCENEYKTISEVIRGFMVKYSNQESNDGENQRYK